MPESDAISYFSSLGSPQTRHVRVAPTAKTGLPSLPGDSTSQANDSTSKPDTDSDTNTSSNALRGDKFTLSKQAETLSADDLRLIQKLAQRDREVRAHEAAHLGAAGGYARGGASFTYQRGPDGVNYAIGGEVSLDTSVPSDPEQALQKADTIRRAALAPAQPSAQDRVVAGQAAQMAAQARLEIASERAEEVAEALEGGEVAEESENETETETTQNAQGEIQEYLDTASAEDAGMANSGPLLNTVA